MAWEPFVGHCRGRKRGLSMTCRDSTWGRSGILKSAAFGYLCRERIYGICQIYMYSIVILYIYIYIYIYTYIYIYIVQICGVYGYTLYTYKCIQTI